MNGGGYLAKSNEKASVTDALLDDANGGVLCELLVVAGVAIPNIVGCPGVIGRAKGNSGGKRYANNDRIR